jgi:hypothetical protein
MSIFVVLSEVDNEKLEALIKEKYSEDYYQLSPRQWLISSGETVIKLTEDLLITDEEKGPGPALVFTILNYYGMADPAIWQWLKAKREKMDKP